MITSLYIFSLCLSISKGFSTDGGWDNFRCGTISLTSSENTLSAVQYPLEYIFSLCNSYQFYANYTVPVPFRTLIMWGSGARSFSKTSIKSWTASMCYAKPHMCHTRWHKCLMKVDVPVFRISGSGPCVHQCSLSWSSTFFLGMRSQYFMTT